MHIDRNHTNYTDRHSTMYEDNSYCQSFLAHTDAEGNVSHSVRAQIFEEHGSDLDEFIGLATVKEALNGRVILAWLGY